MSVRIYELSKKINLTNKETIALLQERGLDVKSASNTIPDIYADDIIQDLAKKEAKPEPKAEEPAQKAPESTKKPALPAGAIVKSADDVAKERAATKQPAGAAPKVAAAPKPAAPPAVKAAPKAPPMPKPVGAGSAPKVPPPAPMRKPAPAVAAPAAPKPAVATAEGEPGAEADSGEPRMLQVKSPIVVRDFAAQLELKPFQLISELMEMGIFASMNQALEEDVASRLAGAHGYTLEIRHRGETAPEAHSSKKKEAPKPSAKMESRPPVVCVLGHVDHGKTTLLDTIRKANVVSGEAGGITQHIGAYQIAHEGKKITFIDTPGHAAFSKMRERGANVTDVAILVVAADDGFMPQTEEALKFAQRAQVPVVVAINKADAKGANVDRVKQQMQQKGIAPEDWGGETLCASVSALKGDGIDSLLEMVLLQAEMLEVQADVNAPAEGTVIESQMEVGRGPTATVIVQQGVLKVGSAIVCGGQYCKVRALMNDQGKNVKSADPSMPVRVLGWSGAPESGAKFEGVKNEKEAKRMAEDKAYEMKREAGQSSASEMPTDAESFLASIASAQDKCLKVIIKGDVHGSVEALKACLEAIDSKQVNLEVVNASVGLVTKNDVATASAAEATIVGFNVKSENGVQAQLKHKGVRLIQHNIIYELIDQVKDAMADLLEPELKENKMGAAQVRQIFPLGKSFVAGCMVTEGNIERNKLARIYRKKEMLHEAPVSTLKRFKDDVTEVKAGYECGIQLSGFSDYQEGDIIECIEIVKVKPKL